MIVARMLAGVVLVLAIAKVGGRSSARLRAELGEVERVLLLAAIVLAIIVLSIAA